jgi:hypothetical protein
LGTFRAVSEALADLSPVLQLRKEVDPAVRVNYVEMNWIGDVNDDAVALKYNNASAQLDARPTGS